MCCLFFCFLYSWGWIRTLWFGFFGVCLCVICWSLCRSSSGGERVEVAWAEEYFWKDHQFFFGVFVWSGFSGFLLALSMGFLWVYFLFRFIYGFSRVLVLFFGWSLVCLALLKGCFRSFLSESLYAFLPKISGTRKWAQKISQLGKTKDEQACLQQQQQQQQQQQTILSACPSSLSFFLWRFHGYSQHLYLRRAQVTVPHSFWLQSAIEAMRSAWWFGAAESTLVGDKPV